MVLRAQANAGWLKLLAALLNPVRARVGHRPLRVVWERRADHPRLFQQLIGAGLDRLTDRPGRWAPIARTHEAI